MTEKKKDNVLPFKKKAVTAKLPPLHYTVHVYSNSGPDMSSGVKLVKHNPDESKKSTEMWFDANELEDVIYVLMEGYGSIKGFDKDPQIH